MSGSPVLGSALIAIDISDVSFTRSEHEHRTDRRSRRLGLGSSLGTMKRYCSSEIASEVGWDLTSTMSRHTSSQRSRGRSRGCVPR